MAIYGAINCSMGEFYKPSLCAHYRRVSSITSLIFFISAAHLLLHSYSFGSREGAVSQCLWQWRQFISRQKSLSVSELWWQQLDTCSAKSWLVSLHFPLCHLLTFTLLTSKGFDSPFGITGLYK